MSDYKWGIDSYSLSNYMDITQAMIDDTDFVIFRLGTKGYGGQQTQAWLDRPLYLDAKTQSNMQDVQAAGKPVGLYIFTYAWNNISAASEADAVCDILDAWDAHTEIPVFWDFEGTADEPMSSYGRLIALGITPTTSLVTGMCSAFSDRCQQRGRRSGLYTSQALAADLFTASWINSYRQTGFFFWLASWFNSGSVPPPPMDCDIWQYWAGQGNLGENWHGTVVDYNWIINDAVIGGDTPIPTTGIPIWLTLKMAGDKHYGKHTILL